MIEANQSRYEFNSLEDALVAFEDVVRVIQLGKQLNIQLADLAAADPVDNVQGAQLGIELARRAAKRAEDQRNRSRQDARDESVRVRYDLLLPLATTQRALREKYGPAHPEVRAVNKRIEAMTELIKEMEEVQGKNQSQMLTPVEHIWLEMLNLDRQERIRLLRAYVHTRLAGLSARSSGG